MDCKVITLAFILAGRDFESAGLDEYSLVCAQLLGFASSSHA